MIAMRDNALHPNVTIVYGADLFPDRKEPHMLYLYGSVPGEPLNVACQLTPKRFGLLQQFVRESKERVIGYNAVRRL